MNKNYKIKFNSSNNFNMKINSTKIIMKIDNLKRRAIYQGSNNNYNFLIRMTNLSLLPNIMMTVSNIKAKDWINKILMWIIIRKWASWIQRNNKMQKFQFKMKIFQIVRKKKEELYSIKINYRIKIPKIIKLITKFIIINTLKIKKILQISIRNLLFSDLSINSKIIVAEEDNYKTI